VATVSGALTAGSAVPSGARIALVWRTGKTGGFAVGADVPLANGRFSMTLAPPPDAYFFPAEVEDYDRIAPIEDKPIATPGAPAAPTPSAEPAPAPDTGGSGPRSLTPRGGTVGGGIGTPLSVALAGFVVYVDTNGNGALDLEGSHAGSPDRILGGNDELILTYLRAGGALDYEKLRDKSGIAPTAGYNLAWDEGRWLPLGMVELKLSQREGLPRTVCSSSGASSGGGSIGTEPVTDVPPSAPKRSSYPDKNDPSLRCAPDGRSFTYTVPCTQPAPPPKGLCTVRYGYDEPSAGCSTIGAGSSLMPGEPVPAGWPCDLPPALDGGSPNIDAGTD
jgi:hypothetical protein